jgi:hypothetical protein
MALSFAVQDDKVPERMIVKFTVAPSSTERAAESDLKVTSAISGILQTLVSPRSLTGQM